MKIIPHLSFSGQCEEAFARYAQLLGGTVSGMFTYGDSPMAKDVPADWRERIIHANLTIEGSTLSGADVLPKDYRKPQGFSVLLEVSEAPEAHRIFSGLSEGGEVHMQLQETFWSAAFGVVVDRFGIPWEINCAQAPGTE